MAPCRVLPNGVPAPIAGSASTTEGPDAPIVFAGRFAHKKGIDVVAAVVRRLAGVGDLRFVLAGGHGDVAARVAVADLADEVGAPCQVLGWLDRDSLDALFGRAALVLVPSRYEPFGMVALEAMRMGAPVLAAAVGGLSEVVTPASGGRLVGSFEAADWCRAIVDLMGSPAARGTLRRRGPVHVARHYDSLRLAEVPPGTPSTDPRIRVRCPAARGRHDARRPGRGDFHRGVTGHRAGHRPAHRQGPAPPRRGGVCLQLHRRPGDGGGHRRAGGGGVHEPGGRRPGRAAARLVRPDRPGLPPVGRVREQRRPRPPLRLSTMALTSHTWQKVMDINGRAFLLGAQMAAELMHQNDGGRIIGLSSLGSQFYLPDYAALGAAKAVMETLARYLAVELAPWNVNVNVVSGGFVDTASMRMAPNFDQIVTDVVARTPAGRVATPEDLAGIVAFLCSPESDWIRGQTLVADGGYSLVLSPLEGRP